MTSQSPSTTPHTPQVFTIFTLPSYEDAVKSSGEPPTYEQALTDLRVDTLEQTFGNPTQPGSATRNSGPENPRRNECNRRSYKCFCWSLAILVILVLGYMIYMGIFRYMSNNKT